MFPLTLLRYAETAASARCTRVTRAGLSETSKSERLIVVSRFVVSSPFIVAAAQFVLVEPCAGRFFAAAESIMCAVRVVFQDLSSSLED